MSEYVSSRYVLAHGGQRERAWLILTAGYAEPCFLGEGAVLAAAAQGRNKGFAIVVAVSRGDVASLHVGLAAGSIVVPGRWLMAVPRQPTMYFR
jgi:hypothetical protein